MNHKIDDATTPEEMRAALCRARRYNNTVWGAFDAADHKGLDGEDRYTLLAYNAVKLANELQDTLFEYTMKEIRPIVVSTKLDP